MKRFLTTILIFTSLFVFSQNRREKCKQLNDSQIVSIETTKYQIITKIQKTDKYGYISYITETSPIINYSPYYYNPTWMYYLNQNSLILQRYNTYKYTGFYSSPYYRY